jgi:ATP-dependent Clp protease protease subunit
MAKQTVYIRFFAGITPKTVNSLMQCVEQKLRGGAERFVILLSSVGGNVFGGISVYNFLKGIPGEVVTHNFGSVDSVAIVLFCAGSKRFCVPHARFLLHGIGLDVPAGARLDEKLLDEKMKSLQIDRENISRVIADNCGKKMEEVDKDMLTGTVLNPEQAENYGLVHEIKSPLFEQGAEVIDITDA